MCESFRVLCLGNTLLADDAFGDVVARQLRRRLREQAEVTSTSATGFVLMDELLNTLHLLVVDTVLTGTARPGTIYTVREEDFQTASGSSPHFVGLFETLALARALDLPAPHEVVIVAVEAADCSTVGGAMHPAVQAAVPAVVRLAETMVRKWQKEVRLTGGLIPHG